MNDYLLHEKRNPAHADLIAGWSPHLQIYVMTELDSYSFCYFCNYYEIRKETYDRFEEPDFDPPRVRLLFSESPVGRKPSEQTTALREKFYGRERKDT